MEFIEPSQNGFTIYSKSGCHNCSKIKKLLHEKSLFLTEVNCDEYLIEDRDAFLSFIQKKTGTLCNIFPIIFYNGRFVGGYNETIDYIQKILLSFEEVF